jgi:hypothetical protein
MLNNVQKVALPLFAWKGAKLLSVRFYGEERSNYVYVLLNIIFRVFPN